MTCARPFSPLGVGSGEERVDEMIFTVFSALRAFGRRDQVLYDSKHPLPLLCGQSMLGAGATMADLPSLLECPVFDTMRQYPEGHQG